MHSVKLFQLLALCATIDQIFGGLDVCWIESNNFLRKNHYCEKQDMDEIHSSKTSEFVMPGEVLEQLDNNYTGVFIFLHGKTRDGTWQKQFFLDLLRDKAQFKHIKVIFPSSPELYCEHTGKVVKAWFTANKDFKIHQKHVDEAVDFLDTIIRAEKEKGIPLNRIIIGGISQGGMLAIDAVYRTYPEVAGCIAVSSIIQNSNIFEAAKRRAKNPPLFMYVGSEDNIIGIKLARESFQQILKAGVPAEWKEFSGAHHELTVEELELIYERVKQLIPEKSL